MQPLPTLRSNLCTWAVVARDVPAIVAVMLDCLPREVYDPGFGGQYLQTTYFDTKNFDLRKARQKGAKYLTLRLRRYNPTSGVAGDYPDGLYVLSAKTETEKFRQ